PFYASPPPLTVPLTERYPRIAGKPVILFVGQLRPRKGADVLLRAAPAILETSPDAQFVFVGPDFGAGDDLRHLATEVGLHDRCFFPGAVDDDVVSHFMKAATVLVFPTVSEIECLGLVFVQAMAAGCPVVASRISGVPEVVRH